MYDALANVFTVVVLLALADLLVEAIGNRLAPLLSDNLVLLDHPTDGLLFPSPPRRSILASFAATRPRHGRRLIWWSRLASTTHGIPSPRSASRLG